MEKNEADVWPGRKAVDSQLYCSWPFFCFVVWVSTELRAARKNCFTRPLDLAAPLNPARITGLSFRRKSTCAINVSMRHGNGLNTVTARLCAERPRTAGWLWREAYRALAIDGGAFEAYCMRKPRIATG